MFTFAETFSKLRNMKKISQRKLAKELNLSHSTICLWESGKRRPDIELLEKIAKYFNVSISDLVSDITDEKQIIKKEFVLSQEKNKLIEKIKMLSDTDCIRLNSYADRLIEEKAEKALNLKDLRI